MNRKGEGGRGKREGGRGKGEGGRGKGEGGRGKGEGGRGGSSIIVHTRIAHYTPCVAMLIDSRIKLTYFAGTDHE